MTDVLAVVEDERKRLKKENKVINMKMEKYETVRFNADEDNSMLSYENYVK
jgi:hypothetical protein